MNNRIWGSLFVFFIWLPALHGQPFSLQIQLLPNTDSIEKTSYLWELRSKESTSGPFRTNLKGEAEVRVPLAGEYRIFCLIKELPITWIDSPWIQVKPINSVQNFQLRFEHHGHELREIGIMGGQKNTINGMILAGGHKLSMDQANRYAGGFDDPGRLATTLAGVQGQAGNNGIIVRGCAPDYLQWKMEGVEIPNPNHFADIVSFGAGGLTALSSHMLDNFDFLTGSIPAEYGNTLSGVMDLRIRKGNTQHRKTILQAGVIGLDAAFEGPLSKTGSSYLFNYRYSTLTLLEPILPKEARGTRFQNLSYKLFFPLRKGYWSYWALLAHDRSGKSAVTDSTLWIKPSDPLKVTNQHYFGAVGVQHEWQFSSKLNYSQQWAWTGRQIETEYQLPNAQLIWKRSELQTFRDWRFIMQQSLTWKAHTRLQGKIGFVLENPWVYVSTPGLSIPRYQSLFTRQFIQFKWEPGSAWKINVGLNHQRLLHHSQSHWEPRAIVLFQHHQHRFHLSYTHLSRMNRLYLYRMDTGASFPNENLGLIKTIQYSAGWRFKPAKTWTVEIDIYQHLLNGIPVVPGSQISLYNLEDRISGPMAFIPKGKARNRGIDLNLERRWDARFFGLFTLSLFQSRFQTEDAIWRPSRFDRRWVSNYLFGKEWSLRTSVPSVMELSIRYTFQGGERITPIDSAASLHLGYPILLHNRAFEWQNPAQHYLAITLSWHRPRKKGEEYWVLSTLNLFGTKEFQGFEVNQKQMRIEGNYRQLIIPSISYRMVFNH